jgi:hypothetical protein
MMPDADHADDDDGYDDSDGHYRQWTAKDLCTRWPLCFCQA